MLTRKELLSSAGHSVVVATLAVLLLFTIGEPAMAAAGSLAPSSDGVSATMGGVQRCYQLQRSPPSSLLSWR